MLEQCFGDTSALDRHLPYVSACHWNDVVIFLRRCERLVMASRNSTNSKLATIRVAAPPTSSMRYLPMPRPPQIRHESRTSAVLTEILPSQDRSLLLGCVLRIAVQPDGDLTPIEL
mmetsp:Transcript_8355/g.31452  ORF Transcript_8355/g.31452 Transcript_8355/m.31452 type:complete len:116 (-) Transcript_8355:291-638(-)